MKKIWNNIIVAIKGACMGAADVIPGVSGGTIAFITGIYDQLIGSINSINAEAVKLFFTGKFINNVKQRGYMVRSTFWNWKEEGW